MHRSRRVTFSALLVVAVATVGALVVWFAFSRVGNDDVSPLEAGADPDSNEIRTDAHSAPHLDLPAGVFVFTDWSGAIYTVRPDGTGVSNVGMAAHFTVPRLVRGGSRVNFEPGVPSPFVPVTRLSPDGWRLATFDKDGVHIANADGSDSRLVSAEITQNPPLGRITWSSDNRHLFVWGGQGIGNGGFDIGALFDIDSGSNQPLPKESSYALAISRSGDHIAYGGRPRGLIVARPDGSDPVDVSPGTEIAYYDVWNVAWSPDDDRLAFPIRSAGYGFAIAAGDGSNTIWVSVPPALGGLAESLVWSPDGRYVALSGDQDPIDHNRVLVFDTGSIGSPPVAFDAGLTGYSGVSIVWWDNGRRPRRIRRRGRCARGAVFSLSRRQD
jgi:WD40 repeat protein